MSRNTNDTRLVAVALVILGASVVLPMFVTGFGMMGFGPTMGGRWGGMWGEGAIPGWMMLVSVLMQLLFLAALVGVGYLVYRAVTRTGGDSDPALEELRIAYARGELTDEEYERRLDALERDS